MTWQQVALAIFAVWGIGFVAWLAYFGWVFWDRPEVTPMEIGFTAAAWPLRCLDGLVRITRRHPVRIGIIVVALALMAVLGRYYLAEQRFAVAIERGRRAAQMPPSREAIEDDTRTQDAYWAGQAWAMAHKVHDPAKCLDEDPSFRLGCQEAAKELPPDKSSQ